MESNPSISVIVPVYNTEKYLERCIDSILNQTFTNFELLLINDGSTDRSGDICDIYQQKDDRIKVFHDKNNGVTYARNIGVKCSKGSYLCFVDADDYLLPHYLETMYNGIGSNGDIAYAAKGNEIVDNVCAIRMLVQNVLEWGIPTKLYKRSLITSDIFDTHKSINIGEDLIGNIKICLKATNFIFVKCDGYVYTMNSDSVTHTRKFSLKYEEMFLREVEEVLKNSDINFSDDMWLFKLRCWKNLVLHGISVDRDKDWIKWIIENAKGKKKTIGDKVILTIPNYYISFILLRVIEIIKKVKSKCHWYQ